MEIERESKKPEEESIWWWATAYAELLIPAREDIYIRVSGLLINRLMLSDCSLFDKNVDRKRVNKDVGKYEHAHATPERM